MNTTNEGRCCDAVLRILEAQHGAKRRDVQRDTARQRNVDLTCTIGSQRYALEHTLIEPFPNNQRDDIAFLRVFDEGFEGEVKDLLRPDLAYDVWVHVYAFDGTAPKELAAIRGALITWIRTSIARLPEPTDFPQTAIAGDPPEVPISVRLGCHRSQGLGGRLLPGRFAPAALEDLRRTRLLKALQDKCPKLQVAKTAGTRTVLVLENRDIALTSEGVVSEMIDELARQVRQLPDDVYIVDLSVRGHSYVTQVRRQGQSCLDVGPAPGRWEFKVEDLDDV